MTFSIANLSDRPYEPVLMHLPPYLQMEAEPKVLLLSLIHIFLYFVIYTVRLIANLN